MIEDATMIAFLFFVWMLVRSQEQENQKDGSRRDSSVRDNRDSRRNSKESASIGHASHLDKRRHRPRRHSRRYYVERNKRWVFYSKLRKEVYFLKETRAEEFFLIEIFRNERWEAPIQDQRRGMLFNKKEFVYQLFGDGRENWRIGIFTFRSKIIARSFRKPSFKIMYPPLGLLDPIHLLAPMLM